MNPVFNKLTEIIRTGSKVVFLGVGSPLRGDDASGLLMVEELGKVVKPESGQEFRFYLGESAPENFSGAIREFEPSQIVIIDAAEFDQPPGSFRLIQAGEIGGVSFSTHTLPLKILAEYFAATLHAEVVFVGIQPKSLEFGEGISPEVTRAVQEFCKQLS